jgi:hypothetical protein
MAIVTASATLAGPFDHLDCRRLRDPGPRARVRGEVIAREPRLAAPAECTIMLPARYLCTAAAAAGLRPEPPGAAPGPEAHGYLCYRARCRRDRQTLSVRDQFGARDVVVRGSRFVCAPLDLPGGSTTTSTTTSSTTSTTLASTTSTLPPPTSTTSTAPPTTSTSSTTTSTLATTTSTQPTTTTSTTSTTTTTLAGPQPPSPGCPVVNEVMTGGASSASEELVEIVNPCAVPLALDGARLLYQSASGATQRTLVTWEPGTVLAPGARLLYATSLFPGPVDGSFAAGLSGTGGGVAVADAAGALVDGVGYGTAANDFVEGSVAPAPAAGSVIARIPDGADTDDGAADWQETAPTPGAAND